MRNVSQIDLLLSEAKKKPEIAHMVERVDCLSETDIDQLSTPLPWYRLALKQLKQKNYYMGLEKEIENHITVCPAPDINGTVVQWQGDPTFITLRPNSELEIKKNQYLFLTSNGVWIDTIYTPYIDPRISFCAFVKSATKTQYRELLKTGKQIPTGQSTPSSLLNRYGVKFFS